MNATDLLSDYVTQEELATALKLSPRTLRRYETLPNGLPSMELGGRKYYNLASVRDWLAKRERHPNPRRRSAA